MGLLLGQVERLERFRDLLDEVGEEVPHLLVGAHARGEAQDVLRQGLEVGLDLRSAAMEKQKTDCSFGNQIKREA